MIDRLTLKNFRGIKEGTIDLSPLTILVGANNSGKSAILEVMFLAPNPFRNVPYYTHLNAPNSALTTLFYLHRTLDYKGYAFLLHNYTSPVSEINWEKKGKENTLKIIMKKDMIYFHSNLFTAAAYNSIRVDESDFDFFGYVMTTNLNEYNNSSSEPFTDQTLLLNPDLSKPFFEFIKNNWAPLVNTGIMRKVAESTSILSPEKYIDLTMEPFIGGSLELYVYLHDGRRIRLGDLGAGIQSYVMAKVLYDHMKPDILLWDDIESHLNPRILRHLAEWFGDLVSSGKQVVIATHSLEALRVIAGVNEEVTTINLTSLQDSVLKTKKLQLAEVENLREAGIDPRTAEAFLI